MTFKHLVVVIPGIGGSVLVDEEGITVWSHRIKSLAAVLKDPRRLDIDRPLRPAGLLQNVQFVPGWTVMHGYTELWHRLSTIPGAIADPRDGGEPNPRANLVAFSYDFRRSNRDNTNALDKVVREQLVRLGRENELDSVVIVAHSMGGLIARHWAAHEGAGLCHALLTLGTPHRGAPKALDVLANGVHVNLRLGDTRLGRLAEVLRAWPSMAELLPRYPCLEDPTTPGKGVYVKDLAAHGAGWGDLARAGQAGWTFHQEIESGWGALSRPPVLRVRVGTDHSTLQSARISAGGLQVTPFAPVWCGLGAAVTDQGDGTVPAISAFPIEVEDHGNYLQVVSNAPVPHGRMGDDIDAASFVEWCEGLRGPTGARGDERTVGLAIEVDEVSAVGEPVGVRVRVVGTEIGHPSERIVRLDITSADTEDGEPGTPRRPVRAVWDEGEEAFVATVPGLTQGSWSVRATALAVPQAGDLSAGADVVIVDPMELEP